MARPTGPKPAELTQLQSLCDDLFATLQMQFHVAGSHTWDLRQVGVPLAELSSNHEVAALAMRYTQFVHQAATPGVAVGSDLVVALATDMNLLLTQLARAIGNGHPCCDTIENARELINKAGYSVIARHGPEPVDLV